MNENVFITLVKNIKHRLDNGLDIVISNFTNYIAKDAQVENIGTIYPWGFGSLANKSSRMLAIPTYGTNQATAIIGVELVIPPVKNDLKDGECWTHSNKYLLAVQNDTVNAYRINDLNYFATLPNGQFMGAMMLNRINELQAEINYLKTHKHEAGNLVAPNGAVTGTTGVPTSPPPEPSTLATDKSYINAEKYLINDKGTMYGQ